MLGTRRVDRIQPQADELTGSGGKALAVATDLTFDADHDIDRQIDAAYRTKYRRYSDSYVPPMISPEARATTLKPVPRSRPA